MNEMQVFQNEEFGEIRTVIKDGEPWWVLRDVCESLGLVSPHKVAERLDEDERNQIPVTDSIGRSQQTEIANESGLYNVILRSDKPNAAAFRRWITHDILPQLRKNGVAFTTEAAVHYIQQPEQLMTILQNWKTDRDARIKLEARVEADAPKVLFADSVTASSDTILIGQLAKQIKQNGTEIGQNRLFERLREDGYLCKQKGAMWNLPTQRAMDQGLFEVQEFTLHRPDKDVKLLRTTKVTGKGQLYFTDKYSDEKAKEAVE